MIQIINSCPGVLCQVGGIGDKSSNLILHIGSDIRGQMSPIIIGNFCIHDHNIVLDYS